MMRRRNWDPSMCSLLPESLLVPEWWPYGSRFDSVPGRAYPDGVAFSFFLPRSVADLFAVVVLRQIAVCMFSENSIVLRGAV